MKFHLQLHLDIYINTMVTSKSLRKERMPGNLVVLLLLLLSSAIYFNKSLLRLLHAPTPTASIVTLEISNDSITAFSSVRHIMLFCHCVSEPQEISPYDPFSMALQ